EINYQSNTRDESKFIVAASSDRTPGARYIYDRKSNTLTKLADINPWIAEADMAPMKPVTYTARDGLAIHAYLTLPVGRAPKNLACIVNPHGGPWVRDGWGYNPEVQFLANRGYCVLQMNYRGSTGYGRVFWEKGFKQWGRAMQDDITDGVKWLVAQGIADPKRVGIYGASYGGYATLAGVTFTPDLYAAAVDYVGVANLFTFMNTIPPYWKPFLDQMYEMVGNPEKDKALLAAASPVLHADRIKTPLFVAQGAKDPRVNKAESDQMVAALRKRGVAVDYMVKDDEGHGFRNEENQFAFYGEMEKFFAKYLRP
ncbi:MAG: S9 family peptidase, partial [Betaproteobacteria bacterium]|nr:S9 family peptidase [Betaproteobacteria bacterium]